MHISDSLLSTTTYNFEELPSSDLLDIGCHSHGKEFSGLLRISLFSYYRVIMTWEDYYHYKPTLFPSTFAVVDKMIMYIYSS